MFHKKKKADDIDEAQQATPELKPRKAAKSHEATCPTCGSKSSAPTCPVDGTQLD